LTVYAAMGFTPSRSATSVYCHSLATSVSMAAALRVLEWLGQLAQEGVDLLLELLPSLAIAAGTSASSVPIRLLLDLAVAEARKAS
jgi:hypothetical protein